MTQDNIVSPDVARKLLKEVTREFTSLYFYGSISEPEFVEQNRLRLARLSARINECYKALDDDKLPGKPSQDKEC